MRFTQILTLATVAVFASATASSAAPSTPETVIAPASLAISAVQDPAEPQAQPQTEIKVDLDDDETVVWYTDPVWLAVGAIALLVVIVLAVMAARGGDRGGTTVIR